MRTKKRSVSTNLAKEAKILANNPTGARRNLKFVPSGCTLINLACSGTKDGFLQEGTTNNIVGDSNSGKTYLLFNSMATTYAKLHGDNWNYAVRDHESGVGFDIRRTFGKRFSKALMYSKIRPGSEATVEALYLYVLKLADMGKPFFLGVDSWDGLTTTLEIKSIAAQMKALHKKKKEDDIVGVGGYNTEKARMGSKYLGKINQVVAETGSILAIISQTRANLKFGSFEKHTRSGGDALRFYSFVECWLSVIKKLGADKKRPIGSLMQMNVKRSKITGKSRRCEFPILYAYGIDNVRGNLSFLLEEGVVKKANGVIDFPRFDFVGTIPNFLKFIDDESLEEPLNELVTCVWEEIELKRENEATCGRKKKFV